MAAKGVVGLLPRGKPRPQEIVTFVNYGVITPIYAKNYRWRQGLLGGLYGLHCGFRPEIRQNLAKISNLTQRLLSEPPAE
jgi:hypothetical protein